MKDTEYMKMALEEAEKAYNRDEVPVGAILVCNDEVIARSFNQREVKQSVLSHAEIEVIKIANETFNSWRLEDCTLYVTLEPCMMCAGAIQQARIKKVVYAASDDKNGFMNEMLSNNHLNHYPEITKGILSEDSIALLKKYFNERRKKSVKVKEVLESELEEYYKVRKEVFILEQNVDPIEEYDEYDYSDSKDVKHIGALINNKVVGTMRLLFDRDEKHIVVGRLAIKKDYRGKGIGSKLLQYAERQAGSHGMSELKLGAQLTAKEFYKSNGYTAYGPIFQDANIDHIMMNKTIKK